MQHTGPHATRTFKRARDVVVGDLVWALPNSDGQSSGLYQVTGNTLLCFQVMHDTITFMNSCLKEVLSLPKSSHDRLPSVCSSMHMATKTSHLR